VAHVTVTDRAALPARSARLTPLACDLTDLRLGQAAAQADGVIHLAAVLGGAAEADPAAAARVNLDATLALMAACRRGARFVFASSLAVLGDTADQRAPVMVYGAHKAMVEIALETATRRGDLDGVALRPGGIVARPRGAVALKSAFLSDVFHAIRDGRDITLPVTPEAETWLASVQTVAGQFVQAALVADPGPVRSLTLPMTRVRIADLVAAIRAACPASAAKVRFDPDAQMMRLFGRAGPLAMEGALALGLRADADLAALVRAAFAVGDTA
jgi:nucleoside-diphosphate-sugar epimerase